PRRRPARRASAPGTPGGAPPGRAAHERQGRGQMRKMLPALLAGLAALVLGLAWAWPAVRRPAAGALVVDVADPETEVTVAGEGVVRRGVGPCPLGLPAGPSAARAGPA